MIYDVNRDALLCQMLFLPMMMIIVLNMMGVIIGRQETRNARKQEE